MKPRMHPVARRLLEEAKRMERRDFGLKTPKRNSGTVYDGDGAPSSILGELAFETPIVDEEADKFLLPTLNEQLTTPGSSLTGRSVYEELMEDRMNGRVPRFEPGPIGAYKRRPVPKTFTLSNWKELERKAMLELRAKNDATLTRLEGSL